MKRYVIVTSVLVVLAFFAPFGIYACVSSEIPDRGAHFDRLRKDLVGDRFSREYDPDSSERDPIVLYQKPAAGLQKVSPDGGEHIVLIYKHKNAMIHLYYKDGLACAASLSGCYNTSLHRWFFLDEKLLAEYAAIPEIP